MACLNATRPATTMDDCVTMTTVEMSPDTETVLRPGMTRPMCPLPDLRQGANSALMYKRPIRAKS